VSWTAPDPLHPRAALTVQGERAERAFDGYTIPTRLRIGWYFGSERFESEGEFFRVTIDRATYR